MSSLTVAIHKMKDLEQMDKWAIANSETSWCADRIHINYINRLLNNPNLLVITAYRNIEILCGYAILQNVQNVLYLELICTMPDTDLRIGTTLMDFMINYARTNGIKVILLDSIVSAIDFYTRYGFVEVGEDSDLEEITGTVKMRLYI